MYHDDVKQYMMLLRNLVEDDTQKMADPQTYQLVAMLVQKMYANNTVCFL